MHALVVHAVVIGVPVMAILTVLVAARPAWRARAGWVVAVLNVLLFLTSLVARQSGHALAQRVGESVVQRHQSLGGVLPWFVLALVAASLLVPLVRHRRPMAMLALALTVVVAGANIWWVVRVGDSGARAVWEGVVQHTQPGG
ncbi:MAG TPA: hypothetical protein VFX33_00075 [Actinomycetales bacterium]|nr:hypothetical protein [Actinomycetales bacterium]